MVLLCAQIARAEDQVAPKEPANQKVTYHKLSERELTYRRISELVTAKCVSCHGTGSSWRDFKPLLSDERLWVSANLVVPQQPQNSLLYRYLQGSGFGAAPFGTMPQGGSLSAAELAQFRDWITQMEAYPNTSSIDDRARQTLRIYCKNCHGAGSRADGGIDYIEDDQKLAANGKIIPRSPAERSPLYTRLTSTQSAMPPSGATPTAAEIANLKLWIETVVPPAQQLSQVAVFYRCYGQLARKRPAANHPLLAAVKAGTMTAHQACMSVFDKAALASTAGGLRLANVNDDESKAVLKTLHNFHQTWWDEDAKLPDNIYADLRHQLQDEGHVHFLTHALFAPNTRYDSILTEQRTLKAKRSRGNWQIPQASAGSYATSYQIEQGELIGYDYFPAGSSSWWDLQGVEHSTVRYIYSPYTVWNSRQNFGGGLIGLQSFIWYFNGYPFMRERANGALRMPRRWAKTIYSALLCRDVPLVRTSDVAGMVAQYLNKYPDPKDHVPFRPDSNCMSCHAGLDPMAAMLRNITFVRTDIQRDPAEDERQAHILMAGGLGTSAAEAEGLHMVNTDANFYARPPNGKVYYRAFDGTLINESISAANPTDALTKLGASLAAKDDLYVCAAARYFNFFTGVKINLLDYQDSRNGGQISEGDMYYRNLVKNYALGSDGKPGLKSHQRLRTLISEIIASPLYQSEGMRDEK